MATKLMKSFGIGFGIAGAAGAGLWMFSTLAASMKWPVGWYTSFDKFGNVYMLVGSLIFCAIGCIFRKQSRKLQ